MYRWMNEKTKKTAFLPVGMQKRRRMGMEIYAICKLLQKSVIISVCQNYRSATDRST